MQSGKYHPQPFVFLNDIPQVRKELCIDLFILDFFLDKFKLVDGQDYGDGI
jgi:hypothetical protein